ncbi:MAG: Stp1/IreP family PP2C-type Ser/Thr phosphatase [Clostridia bacterium]
MKFVAKTDVGRKRANNEDSFFVKKYDEETYLYIVADGLGGYESGEVASSMLTRTISKYFEEHLKYLQGAKDDNVEQVLETALTLANEEIYRLEKTDAKYKGMGTTVVVVLKINKKIFYISIGDSRMYYIDRKMSNISQVTVDDTYVNELIKTNVITEEEAKTHPQKHVLTKAVGVLKRLTTKTKIFDKEDGYLILCTDGLTNMLQEMEILNVLKKLNFDKVVDKLIQKSNDNGGVDNITVIVVEL